MNVIEESETLQRCYAQSLTVRNTAFRWVFGDQYGKALFLGSLCFFMLYWRLAFFITDSAAMASTLVNVADGHLYLTDATYGSGLDAPGTYVSGDRVYGRNYGIVFRALPVLWLLQGVSTVVDIPIALVATWSLLLLAFGVTVARILDREWIVALASVLAVGAFIGSLATATPLNPRAYPHVSFQILSMIATALSGVFLYRIIKDIHGRREGLFAAGGALLASPMAFWASIPKRHAFTVLLLIASAYALYRSRRVGEQDVFYRALAYVPVGLLAWVHSAEALLVFLPLVVVDGLTAPTTDRRTIGIVVLAFLLSLLPFFLTNVAISGNPLQPPRLLPAYGTATEETFQGGSSDVFLGNTIVSRVASKALSITTVFGSQLLEGVVVLVSEPGTLYRTFVRSGYIPAVAEKGLGRAIDLTVLEAAPLLGALVGVPVAIGSQLRTDGTGRIRQHLGTPTGALDAFFAGTALLFVLLYLPQLPLHAQTTVRYLHPVYPIGIYGVIRLGVVRGVIADHWKTSLWTYTGCVLIGGQLLLAFMELTSPTQSEAVQLHALISLATAALLAVWILAAAASKTIPREYGAVAIAVTAAGTTLFVLLSGLEYFDLGNSHMLPFVRMVAEAVSLCLEAC